MGDITEEERARGRRVELQLRARHARAVFLRTVPDMRLPVFGDLHERETAIRYQMLSLVSKCCQCIREELNCVVGVVSSYDQWGGESMDVKVTCWFPARFVLTLHYTRSPRKRWEFPPLITNS